MTTKMMVVLTINDNEDVLTVNEEEESLANLKRPRRWHSVACNAIETGLIMLMIIIIIIMILSLNDNDVIHLPASAAVRLTIVRTEPLLFESTLARESALS